MYRNELHERVLRGQYVDVLDSDWYKADATIITSQKTTNEDNRAGKVVPQTNQNTPFALLEQHCDLDLDGDVAVTPGEFVGDIAFPLAPDQRAQVVVDGDVGAESQGDQGDQGKDQACGQEERAARR